jgi:hypothetical protein
MQWAGRLCDEVSANAERLAAEGSLGTDFDRTCKAIRKYRLVQQMLAERNANAKSFSGLSVSLWTLWRCPLSNRQSNEG